MMRFGKEQSPALLLADLAARPLLTVASLLPLLLLALLAAALMNAAPARAEPATCNGKSLLPEIEASNPVLYRETVTRVAAEPNAHGIFWKIEKAGLEPSWLLGTMHVTDPRVTALPEAAQAPYAEADTVVIEATEILNDQQAAAAMLRQPNLTMLPDGKTIQSLIDSEEVAKLDAGLKTRGIPLIAVSRMQPWLLSSFVAMPACENARKQSGLAFLDKKLALDAQNEGRQVLGLETLNEQLQAMTELPVEFHIKGLIEMLALGDRMEDVFETMTVLYLEGRVGEIMPVLKIAAPGVNGDKSESYADFEGRLIRDRNYIMADRAAPILENGNVFIAVGALHLPGAEGVVSLLQKKGFTVTRVY